MSTVEKTDYDVSGVQCIYSWWRHQIVTSSALLVFCAANSPVTGEFPAQRPVARSFDISFDLQLNQQLSKPWRRRWFKTPSRSLWRHCNVSVLPSCIPNMWNANTTTNKLHGEFLNSARHLRAYATTVILVLCTLPWCNLLCKYKSIQSTGTQLVLGTEQIGMERFWACQTRWHSQLLTEKLPTNRRTDGQNEKDTWCLAFPDELIFYAFDVWNMFQGNNWQIAIVQAMTWCWTGNNA